jgi:ParB-like chromosome segregation protein Spo0J
VIELDDRRAFLMALHENIHRSDLHAIDLARSCKRLLDEGWAKNQEDVAKALGVSRSRVTQLLAVLGLPENVTRVTFAGNALSERHMRELLKISEPTKQAALAAQIEAEKLTVEQTARRVKAHLAGPKRRRGRAARTWHFHDEASRYSSTKKVLLVELKGDRKDRARLLREIADKLDGGDLEVVNRSTRS